MTEIGRHKDELDTPVLWADLDILEHNIATLAAHFQSAGVNWRPHIKGVKIPAIAHMLLAAGAIGVTCAKMSEAEVMAAAGIRDIMIANQIVGAQKYVRLANLCRHADVKVAVDSTATLADLGAAAIAKGVEIGVVIELNTGMERAGVQPGAPVVELARRVQEQRGLRFAGLMTWEGHTVDIQDPKEKQAAVSSAIDQLMESVELCRQAGRPVEIVSCGGSGTYHITPFMAGVTEIQAGGAIFCDVTYQRWGVQTEPALFVRSVVNSRPAPNRIIFDAGFKTLPNWSLPNLSLAPKPLGIDGIESVVMSAEHGIITLESANDDVKIGDVYDFMLSYGDSTLFLHDRLYGIRDGIVEVIWTIEGRGKIR